MRRGWMDWVAQEVPRDTLAQRVRSVAEALEQRGLGALVLYSGFPRAAQVSALSHFVPFWSQALLVVTRSGRSLLTMATTGRTVQWIHTTSVVDEVLVGADIGAVAARWLQQQGLADQALGVAALDDLPHAVHAALAQGLGGHRLVEASAWYAGLAAGFGATPAVAARAHGLARTALDGVAGSGWRDAHAVVAALDAHCRSQGAEEVAVYLAPDLQRDARLRRLEGAVNLGASVALQLSLAYKGHWLRLASSFDHHQGRLTPRPRATALHGLLDQAQATGAQADAALAQLGLALESGRVEGVRGGVPLATLRTLQAGAGIGDWPAAASLTLVLREAEGSRLLITHSPAAATAA